MKSKAKQLLDYLPFTLLIIYTVIEWMTHYVNGIQISWQTFAGISLLLVNAILFIRYHQLSVLFIGLLCLLGLFGFIMLSPSSTTTTIGEFAFRFGDINFLAVFIIHLIISFRFYIGIATRTYWNNLFGQLKHPR